MPPVTDAVFEASTPRRPSTPASLFSRHRPTMPKQLFRRAPPIPQSGAGQVTLLVPFSEYARARGRERVSGPFKVALFNVSVLDIGRPRRY